MHALYVVIKGISLPFIIAGELMFWIAEFILSCLPDEERNWP